MANPARDTTAGRVYNDLRNLARRNSRSTDEVMVEYVLERFLYRLASSPLGREHFVLKGGLLLAQFGARRMTRDIDILGRSFPGRTENRDHPQNRGHGRHPESDDGVVFDPAALSARRTSTTVCVCP
ncbi:nucleotidyl transferase AbiEii/AbiGii toxin family protein [Streptomyces blattellae]|nr:nucleotidyl transferase AbiEii/AbiGii toxin family protein [Streptomyces blattellae]